MSPRHPRHPRLHFVTFAPTRELGERLYTEAVETGLFDTTRLYTPTSPELRTFVAHHFPYIDVNPDNFGHGLWKPCVIMACARACNEGDLVLYMDYGCTISVEHDRAYARFDDYVHLVEEKRDGVLAFQLSYQERDYSDPNAMVRLACTSAWACKATGQIISDVILIKNTPTNQQLLATWGEMLARDNYTNMVSFSPWLAQHRYEQSVWSILLKQHPGTIVLHDETHEIFQGRFGSRKSQHFPFWVTRRWTLEERFSGRAGTPGVPSTSYWHEP